MLLSVAIVPSLGRRGRAVQVDPMRPRLKAPKSKLLRLKHEKVLSSYGFEFNLRRCAGGRTSRMQRWKGLAYNARLFNTPMLMKHPPIDFHNARHVIRCNLIQ